MFILAIVPGMPHLAFLSFTGLLLFAARQQSKKFSKQILAPILRP